MYAGGIDDFKNSKYTAKMMGIPSENILEFKDASHTELEDHINWLCYRIGVLAKILVNETGIAGFGFLQGGL